jgi:hypothetical protein
VRDLYGGAEAYDGFVFGAGLRRKIYCIFQLLSVHFIRVIIVLKAIVSYIGEKNGNGVRSRDRKENDGPHHGSKIE